MPAPYNLTYNYDDAKEEEEMEVNIQSDAVDFTFDLQMRDARELRVTHIHCLCQTFAAKNSQTVMRLLMDSLLNLSLTSYPSPESVLYVLMTESE